MKLIVTKTKPLGYTTVGYWRWTKPNNKGVLEVYVAEMKSTRHFFAVLGHELIEVFYCWLFRITTEAADEFDKTYEKGYADGTIPLTKEPGHDPACPYHWGHMLGVVWEYVWIYGTFGSWKCYTAECDQIMDIFDKTV